jgi:hypothetical protein
MASKLKPVDGDTMQVLTEADIDEMFRWPE